MIRRVALWFAAIVLAAVFFAAGIPKALDPAGFGLAIYRHHLAPSWAINLMAIALPWIELVAAACILVPRTRRGAALAMLLMLIVFTAAVAINVHRGLDISCGCFSTAADESHPIGWRKVFENLGLILLAAFVLWRKDEPQRHGGTEQPVKESR